jgi:ribulose-phosphate 3-epimerase
MKKRVRVFPSILAGDFGRIADEAKRAEDAGADGLHLDVMDGHFVPNLSFGPKVVAAINRATSLFLDVHLMMYNPYEYVERFVESGADGVTFHFEATEDVRDALAFIRKCGVKSGLALRPETSPEMVQNFMTDTDLILFMSVNPGFGGQEFMPKVLKKIAVAKDFAEQLGAQVDIQVDGGINAQTGARCAAAGATVLVAGSYLYKAPDMKRAIESLR